MKSFKALAAAVFAFSMWFGVPTTVQASWNCSGASCYGRWGNMSYDYCTYSGSQNCNDAHETCDSYCNGHIRAFSCDPGDVSGDCECNPGISCPSCNINQDNCEPSETFDYFSCSCVSSPIIADLAGNGIALTSPAEGVFFDLNGDGSAERVSWTAAGADDGFLVLDRDNNGLVDDGRELFGTATAQPEGSEPNGFLALAVFDNRSRGGNADGVISKADAVFDRLVFWSDTNHDGVSQATEMRSMQAAGVRRIGLDFSQSTRRDQHGNIFRYKSRVWDNVQHTRWIWDVFLRVVPTT